MRVIIKPGGLAAIAMALVLAVGIVVWEKTRSKADAGSAGADAPRVLATSAAPGGPGERKGEIVPAALLYSAEGSEPKPATARLINGATHTKLKEGFSLSLAGTQQQYADAGKPLVDTTKSFTVSVWVRFNNTEGYQTFVSQDGTSISGFYLQKRQDSGKFSLTLNSDDAVPPQNPGADIPIAGYRAQSSFTPQSSVWYHVVGVYDEKQHQTRLYVNGSREETTNLPKQVKLWQAKGSTVFGGGMWEGKRVDYANATLEDIRIYPSVLPEAEITRLYKSRK